MVCTSVASHCIAITLTLITQTAAVISVPIAMNVSEGSIANICATLSLPPGQESLSNGVNVMLAASPGKMAMLDMIILMP